MATDDSDVVVAATAYYYYLDDEEVKHEAKRKRVCRQRRYWIHDIIRQGEVCV